MFGGFILHFLLCNYLTVLLRPRYEEPVETAEDLINRNITPFYTPDGEMFRQFFAGSNDTNYQEISRRLIIPKDWVEYGDLASKVTSTGMYALPHTVPWGVPEKEYKQWYRSTQTMSQSLGLSPYVVHLSNKKWSLKKVLM